VERDRLLIQTRNRCMGIEGLLVRPQNIFQLCDIFFIEFGRGRDAGHPAPPAQIPTSGIMEMARIRPNPTQFFPWCRTTLPTFASNWSNSHLSGASVKSILNQGQLRQHPKWPNFRSALVLKLVNEFRVNGTALEFRIGTNESIRDYSTGWVQRWPAMAREVLHSTYSGARYAPINDDGNLALFCGVGGFSTCEPGEGN
jgi:hypothetical protein